MGKTNLTPTINHLRRRLHAVAQAIGTFESIAEQYLEKKAESASLRSTEPAPFLLRSKPAASESISQAGRRSGSA